MTDDEGFEMFFAREYPAVVRAVFLATGDRAGAEDVAQDAFARLFLRWAAVSTYERPDAWVRRIAMNMAISSWRRKPRFAAAPSGDDSPDERLDLHRAILDLPKMQRAMVVLHYFEDRGIEESARIVGCSAATARVHLHRARKRLGAQLGDEVLDDAR